MAAVMKDYQRPDAGGEIDTVRALLHDLRQPLAAILLLAGTEGGDTERRLDVIYGQARWLADLVESGLSEAAGDDETSTDVGAVVESVVARARTTADATIDVQVVTGSEAWARPVALSRALACVVDNAVRAAGDDGTVTVRVHENHEGVHVTVTDDGPGLGHVAARTSLGLTTTRAMIAACNGSFRLHSAPGGGAVAAISLAHAQLGQVAS